MPSRRPPIPGPLQLRLLYESAYVCSVCQDKGTQIHHIDGDHSNNAETNLIVVCLKHHDEAHTHRTMSKNLSAAALRNAKKQWTSLVMQKRSRLATVSGQKQIAGDGWTAGGIVWGYINHKRVAQMISVRALDSDGQSRLQLCVARGIVDERGVIIKPQQAKLGSSYLSNTVYDWFEYGDDQRLHSLYSAMADSIGSQASVIHIEPESWTKSRLQQLLSPGSVFFLERGFSFRQGTETVTNQHRRCAYFKQGIEAEFFVDTLDMFGVTSMTVSFSGKQTTAALVQLKSMAEAENGRWRLHCTPIAMGIGFQRFVAHPS